MSDAVIFTADQIGDVEAMYIAAMRGLSLKDVGVKESKQNVDDFEKIKAEVNTIFENGDGLAGI